MVEQPAVNRRVTGSSPVSGANSIEIRVLPTVLQVIVIKSLAESETFTKDSLVRVFVLDTFVFPRCRALLSTHPDI